MQLPRRKANSRAYKLKCETERPARVYARTGRLREYKLGEHFTLDDQLIFAISLKSAAVSVDWGQVQRNLAGTLASIAASGHPGTRVVIAGHERPEVSGLFDFLPSPFPPPKDVLRGSGDKFRKRRLIGAWVRQEVRVSTRIMFLDADDLVHRDVPQHVLTSDPALNHLVEQGYRYDAVRRALEPVSEGFWRYCGSCFVGAFTRDDLPRTWEDEANVFISFGGNHLRHAEEVAAIGRVVAPVPFPAAVYLLNHGDSLDFAKKGRKKALDGPMLDEVEASRILREDFGVDVPAAEAAPVISQHRERWRARKARTRASDRRQVTVPET